MDKPWEQLYRLQDEALAEIQEVRQGLYLTGGTALSRGYYQHRNSDDLDFFLNDAPDFELVRDRCLAALEQAGTKRGWRQPPSEVEFRAGLESLVQKIVQ